MALKLIHPQIAADPSFRERFLDEAELGRRVQHPGLARVYDVVMEGPWLGTVLEHIEGKELTAWVRPGGLPVKEVVSLLTPLAEALDHLHSQGIVHRDLKPANVRVRPDGRAVLLDLGIAKDLSGEAGGQTKTMTTMGTSAWMAPEQADAKSVTAAADVYAFGLMAYALLSGRMPWPDGATEHRVIANKMMGKLESLGSVVPGLSLAVSSTVMVSLSVDAGARPESCGALVVSLDATRRAAEEAKRAAQEKARGEALARKAAGEKARRAAAARKAAEEKSRREAAEQARREADARQAAEEKARRQVADQARREAAARMAAAHRERALREAGPHPHTHRYEGPIVKRGFLFKRVVDEAQERIGERFEVGVRSLVLVTISADTYVVGSGPNEGDADERPEHKVRLSRGYSMGIHPVTQGVYQAVMGTNPARFSGRDGRMWRDDYGEAHSARRPVERVSWFDAVAFCNRLSDWCGLPSAYRIQGEQVSCDFRAPGFRLPTEHEWEVAARAATSFRCSGSDEPDSVGWFMGNSGAQTHPVGQKAPNGWGLYDMSGNVSEWCWDWMDFSAYQRGTMEDPVGPQSGNLRAIRGSSYLHYPGAVRVAGRMGDMPDKASNHVGFRLVRTLA